MATIGPFDFTGGYCPGYDYTMLPQSKGYANVLYNARIKNGCVTFRYGYSHLNSNTGFTAQSCAIDSVYAWFDTPNSKMALVTTFKSKVWTADVTSATPSTTTVSFTDRTGALAAASLSSTYTNYDSLNNILVGSCNSASSGAIFKVTAYNANAAALAGSPPSADIVKQCNNFMFLARNLSSTTTQSKVYWSNVNDPETWGVGNVLDFKKNDGEPIMALGSIGTDLYIFKQSSIGRLSTVTITTSGAVTLGPLVTVVQGVGCCGPRALDNLPNGNIVFVSYDGHFYEFDGSTLIDRSKEPYPGKNVFDNGYYASITYSNFGFSGCVPDTTVNVKTNTGANEVWISFFQPLDNGGNTPVFWYDFINQRFNGWSGTQNSGSLSLNCMTALPFPGFQNPIESRQFIVYGTTSASTPGIFSQGLYTIPYSSATNISGTVSAKSLSVGTTIQLPVIDGKTFIPRSIAMDVTSTQSSGSGSSLASFEIKYAYDKFFGDTYTAYTGTAGAILPSRIVAPLTFNQDSTGTNLFPIYISVLVQASGQGTGVALSEDILRIGKFWLSDEVIR